MKLKSWAIVFIVSIIFSLLIGLFINYDIKYAEKRTIFLKETCLEHGFRLQLEQNPKYVASCLEIRDGIIHIYYYDELEGNPYLREGLL